MNFIKSIIVLASIIVSVYCADASTTSDTISNILIQGVKEVCPDDDGDGFDDKQCGGLDCDDSDELINPDADEVCNGVDDNCNFFTDEGFDMDFDGFTTCEGDCDDQDRAVNPGIEEWCFNGKDDDCDGMVDCDDEDDDNDLVDDDIEDKAPNDGDGNNDGKQDSRQTNVISIPAETIGTNNTYVTLETDPQHKLFAAMGIHNPSPFNDPADVIFPLGFFEFEIELKKFGEESYIVLYKPENIEINTYWKYGPTPNNQNPHWYEFLFDGETGAQFLKDKIVLRFVDGERGDDDITVNGLIFEPGGPGFIEILEEEIDESDGCSIAGSSNKDALNTAINLLIPFIPLIAVAYSRYRKTVS